MTRQAMEILCGYDWPGNVRELENAIERAATLCEGNIIQAGDLPPSLLASVKTHQSGARCASCRDACPKCLNPPCIRFNAAPQPAPRRRPDRRPAEPLVPLKTFLRQQEQAHLIRAIQQCGGDKEQAALLLGISIATLYRRLAEEDAEP